MALELGDKGFVDSAVLDRIPKGIDIIAEVEKRLESAGIRDIAVPTGEPPPSLTEIDATTLDLTTLEDLYTKYVGYAQFVYTALTRCEIVLKAEENRLRLTKRHVEQALIRGGMAKTTAAAEKETHADVEAVLTSVMIAQAEKSMVEAVSRSYTNQAKALSRVIEIRKLEFEQTGRAGNLNRPPAAMREDAKNKLRRSSILPRKGQ